MSSLDQKKASVKIESPEQLDKLIEITPPLTWMVISGSVIMIIAFVIWGYFGTISRYKEIKGIAAENEVIAFVSVDDAGGIVEGGTCIISITSGKRSGETVGGRISSIDRHTVTVEEAAGIVQDDALGTWFVGDAPVYLIHISYDPGERIEPQVLTDVQVVVSRYRPYQLVFR